MLFSPRLRSLFPVGFLKLPERTVWSKTPWHTKYRPFHSFSSRSKNVTFFRPVVSKLRCRHNANGQFIFCQSQDRSCLHTPAHAFSDFKPTPPDQDPSLEWERSGKEFLHGPDQTIPSKALYTTNIRGAVQISKLSREPGNSRVPISVPRLLIRRVESTPAHLALAVKRDGLWKKYTFEQYYEDVRKAAKAFIALGLERFGGVSIMGFNSPEWFIANMGAISAGGIPAGIYTTNAARSAAYIAEDSKANIIVVEDDQQLSKILQYRKNLPHLRSIVQYTGKPGADGVLSWKELMDLGAEQSDDELEKRLKQIAINQCCTLIYTSGTTGNPKGVMLSHDNMTWLAQEAGEFGQFSSQSQEIISFLPLSHIAAQHADMYLPLLAPGTVYFADPDALKGTLINTLREVQPTVFVAVPRVWEKFYCQLKEIGRKNAGIKLKVVEWAKTQAIYVNTQRMAGKKNPETLQFKLADKLILSRIRHAMGLSRCEICISSAAPISRAMLEYFMSLNIVIGEAYGLSECSGPQTMSVQTKNIVRFGSIGQCTGSVNIKLDKPTADGQGEICIGGRHVLMGYLNDEKKTREAVDSEGWLHSEDLGRIDEDGYVFVTGRLKELLITAGGENVAPVPIEDNIKAALPCLSNVMVIGDKLKFLSALMTFKTEVNPDTQEPLEQLAKGSKKWIEKHGNCIVNTVKDALDEIYEKKNSKLINAINSGVMLANTKSVSRPSKVKKWVILPKDFSIPGGELGPTLKLKRSVALQKYENIVREIYKDGLDPNSTGALG